MEVGNVLSRTEFLKVLSITPYSNEVILENLETGTHSIISKDTAERYLNSDKVVSEVIVTKAGTRNGLPGIRAIFDSIAINEIFTVKFIKQEVYKTEKKCKEDAEVFKTGLEAILKNTGQNSHLDIRVFSYIESNKHLLNDSIKGEERTLVGYKTSSDEKVGRFICKDLGVPRGENNIRMVDSRTITELIHNNIKYIVK